MPVEIAGRIKDDAGDAVNGASVNIYARGTTTPSLGSDTTDANGEFDITYSSEAAVDVKVVNGSDVLWRSSRDQIQVQTVQVWQDAVDEYGLVIVRAEDAASVEVAKFEGNRATPTDNDAAYVSLYLSNDAGEQTEFGRITWTATDVSDGTEDGQIKFSAMSGGSLTDLLTLPLTGLTFVSAVKSADETRNSTTTLAVDSDLDVAVEANSTYEVEMFVHMVTNTTPDFKHEVRVPSGATVSLMAQRLALPTSVSAVAFDGSGEEAEIGLAESHFSIRGFLVVGGTAGDFEYWWAQNTSNAADTTVKAGSWVRIRKVA